MEEKSRLDKVLGWLMWVMFVLGGIALLGYSHDVGAITFFVLGGWLRILQERGLLVRITTHKIFIWFLGILFSCSYFIAEKYLNSQFQIEREYLSNSPWIGAIFFSVLLIFLTLEIVVIVFFLLSLINSKLEIKFKEEKKQDVGSILFTLVCALFGVIPLIIGMSVIQNKVFMVSLRIDSYTVSDCGLAQPSVSYLRKNDRQCYKFEPWFGFSQPVVIESKKGS